MPSAAAKIERELMALIKKKVPKSQVNYVSGLYRFMAKLDAIENCLVRGKVIDKRSVSEEMKVIYRYMKKDFK